MSQPNGNSDIIARRYMDRLIIEERVLGSIQPTTRVRFLGRELEIPIMPAALSFLKGGMAGYAEGARQAGAAVCIGMGDEQELEQCLQTGAQVIKIVKPYADREETLRRIRYAEEHGAIAVGMDVGRAFKGDTPSFDTIHGYPMQLPTLDELRAFISATRLPFFVKDVLSVRDALTARHLGAAGVIVGHHHNRMTWAPPPVYLIREIRKAVGKDLILIADGGIEDGYDAFKALALGADMVSVGRSLMQPYEAEGPAGVAAKLRAMTTELASIMYRTGSERVDSIDPGVIHEAWWM